MQGGARRRPGKGALKAAAAAAAAASKGSEDSWLSGVIRMAARNWILTLLAVLCFASFVFVFMETLADAREFVRKAGYA